MLLQQAGVEYCPVDPPIAEPKDIDEGLTPSQHAEALAYFKASSVERVRHGGAILGADTVVSLDGDILGKAPGPVQAAAMLARLSGTRHEVITGVALLGPDNWRMIASEITYVTMRTMTDAEIDEYVQSGEWRGKAGSYAIQETGDRFVTSVEGSFSNVVGLPMELVARMLNAFDTRTDGV